MTENRYIKLLLWGAGCGTMDKCEKAADALVAKGFRRQSEVVESIFKDIYKILADADIKYEEEPEYGNPIVGDIFNAISELRKRYMEGNR